MIGQFIYFLFCFQVYIISANMSSRCMWLLAHIISLILSYSKWQRGCVLWMSKGCHISSHMMYAFEIQSKLILSFDQHREIEKITDKKYYPISKDMAFCKFDYTYRISSMQILCAHFNGKTYIYIYISQWNAKTHILN